MSTSASRKWKKSESMWWQMTRCRFFSFPMRKEKSVFWIRSRLETTFYSRNKMMFIVIKSLLNHFRMTESLRLPDRCVFAAYTPDWSLNLMEWKWDGCDWLLLWKPTFLLPTRCSFIISTTPAPHPRHVRWQNGDPTALVISISIVRKYA